ncbi:MAG: invasion associated locus B family protein [Enterobacterales bacterium]
MKRLLAGVVLCCMVAGSQVQAVLPDGADAMVLQERYGNWMAVCQESKAKAGMECSAVQVQATSGIRVLSAQLSGTPETSLTGKLVLPFGMALMDGISLSADDKEQQTLKFSTCVPEGCVIPVQWNKEQLKTLMAASKWTLTGKNAAEADKKTELQLPVDGLDKALRRIQFLEGEKADTPPSS